MKGSVINIPPKSKEKIFPRVLIVYHSCVNKIDQQNLSLRSWFNDWPRENLAQIYSGNEVGDERYCGYTFKLSIKERNFGKVFFLLKRSSLGENSMPVIMLKEDLSHENIATFSSRMKRIIGRILLNSGLWELVFMPKLSSDLIRWVQYFRPEIIYCQGYTLTFSWLPLMLQKKFNLPICFQTGDDWPMNLYSNSPLSFIISRVVKRSAKRLIRNSSVRFSNGETMSQIYLKRYGVTFEPLMMCDDIRRFNTSEARRIVNEGTVSVVYSGSLGSRRCESLLELCEVAQELHSEGIDIMITAFASGVPPEKIEILSHAPCFQLLSAPTHEDLPAYLKGADVLFLPESFNETQANGIRLSISSKAHLYMMSKRPVLIYAPPIAGIMDYARYVDWGCLVDRQDPKFLKESLRKLIIDKNYCHQIISKGIEIALQRHDATVVRERVREAFHRTTMGQFANIG